jgi:hypothetical protein
VLGTYLRAAFGDIAEAECGLVSALSIRCGHP